MNAEWSFTYSYLSTLTGYKQAMIPDLHYAPIQKKDLSESYCLVRTPGIDGILLYHKPTGEMIASVDQYHPDVLIYRGLGANIQSASEWLHPIKVGSHCGIITAKVGQRDYFAAPDNRISTGYAMSSSHYSMVQKIHEYIQRKTSKIDIEAALGGADPDLNCSVCVRTVRKHIMFHLDREQVGRELLRKLTGIADDKILQNYGVDEARQRLLHVTRGLITDMYLGFNSWYNIPEAHQILLRSARGY